MFRRCREPGVVGDKCDREALQLLCRYSNLPTQLLIDRPDLLGPLASKLPQAVPLPALLAMERERRQGGPPPGAGDGGPAANRTHTLLSQQGRYEEGMEGWMVDSHREPALPHWLQAARAGTRAERSQQQQPQQVLRPAQQPQPQSLEPPLQQCKAGPASPSSPTSPCQLRMFTTRQYRRVPRAPRMLPAWLLAALVTVYVFFGLAHALGPLRQCASQERLPTWPQAPPDMSGPLRSGLSLLSLLCGTTWRTMLAWPVWLAGTSYLSSASTACALGALAVAARAVVTLCSGYPCMSITPVFYSAFGLLLPTLMAAPQLARRPTVLAGSYVHWEALRRPPACRQA